MSSIKFELEAELRNDIGRGASRRLRQANKIPAVIYGADKEAVTLALDHNKTMNALSHEAFYSHILTLKMGKTKEKVILKDLQRHPVKPRIQHIDFLRVSENQKLHMNVPLHFKGEDQAPGLKEGGVWSHHMNDVEVSCLPANLPEFIEVDLSEFKLNQTLHITELKLPKGVELVALAHGAEGHDLPVASLHVPRVVEEVTTEAVAEAPAEGAPPAEGEEKKAKE
ncbi:MAG: 50S ribosomal protein L25/general stress protein Ctc [Gammaproteobacteria bacterium]|nr:50S ribosomal protein L25/general stress protein Ctc [Gammaproteobacteria bacterium]